MPPSPKPSASVTIAAVVDLVGSFFLVLGCAFAFFGMLAMKLPEGTPGLPPFAKSAALVTLGFMICVSVFGIATGIGLIYLRNWARISALTWAGFSVFFSVIGLPFVFLMPMSSGPNAPDLPAASLTAVRLVLLFFYGIPLLIGIWWLVLFNRKNVKAQFTGSELPADPSRPPKPACPLPISVMAWFYITAILNLLIFPFLPFRVPVFVFGLMLNGSVGMTVLIVICLAFFVAGIGLLKLKPWSYSLAIGLQLFCLASMVVTVLNPNYNAVMDSLIKEMQASMHLPATSFSAANFSHNYIWTLVLGLFLAGAILGLFVYYRPRFLEEASRAASTS